MSLPESPAFEETDVSHDDEVEEEQTANDSMNS